VKIQKVEFTLEMSEIRGKLIYIQEIRDIFPPLNSTCTIRAGNTQYIVPIKKHGNSGYHIHLADRFNRRSNSELIGNFTIEVIIPMQEYSLR
jgi:hypothetical protein